jgi:protease IV
MNIKFSEIVRDLFFVIIIVNLFPVLISSIRKQVRTIVRPTVQIGVIPFNNALLNSDYYAKLLKKYFKDDEVKGIVLHFKTAPGGASGSGQVIFEMINDLKKEHPKPVVAVVENMCASAAYYIASTANRIIVTPSSLVGNIGAYIALPQLKEFIEQFKIKYTVVQAGTYKMAGDPFMPSTPENTALLQEMTIDTYRQFTEDVQNMRAQLKNKPLSEWADGKTFTGKQALEIGLVDQLGTLLTAEKWLKETLKIEHEIEWLKPSKGGFFSSLVSSDDDEVYLESLASRVLHTFLGIKI